MARTKTPARKRATAAGSRSAQRHISPTQSVGQQSEAAASPKQPQDKSWSLYLACLTLYRFWKQKLKKTAGGLQSSGAASTSSLGLEWQQQLQLRNGIIRLRLWGDELNSDALKRMSEHDDVLYLLLLELLLRALRALQQLLLPLLVDKAVQTPHTDPELDALQSTLSLSMTEAEAMLSDQPITSAGAPNSNDKLLEATVKARNQQMQQAPHLIEDFMNAVELLMDLLPCINYLQNGFLASDEQKQSPELRENATVSHDANQDIVVPTVEIDVVDDWSSSESSLSNVNPFLSILPGAWKMTRDSGKHVSNPKLPENADTSKAVLSTYWWQEKGTNCFQATLNDTIVSRREDTGFVNCTNLLKAAGVSKQKSDSILQHERGQNVSQAAEDYLNGVWLSLERAAALATQFDAAGQLQHLLKGKPRDSLVPIHGTSKKRLVGPPHGSKSTIQRDFTNKQSTRS